MSIINSCANESAGANTGVECGKSLAVLAGVILVPASARWTESDMENFYEFLMDKIHADASDRFYPIFADVKNYEATIDSDTTETYADGTSKLIRLGGYTHTLTLADGGECLAKTLMSFIGLGYRVVVVDKNSQFKVKKYSDGTYGGLKTTDINGGPSQFATFTTSYLNKFVFTITPEEYITKAEIFKNSEDLTELQGLLDVKITEAVSPTASKVTVKVLTECAGTDLYGLYADQLAVASAFVVKSASGSTKTVTVAKNVTNKGFDLSGSFAEGDTVSLSDPSTLKGLQVVGYETTEKLTVSFQTS